MMNWKSKLVATLNKVSTAQTPLSCKKKFSFFLMTCQREVKKRKKLS